MTVKTRLGAPRTLLFTTASPFPMLRGPAVAYAPDDDGGGDEEADLAAFVGEGAREGEDTGNDDAGGGEDEGDAGGEGDTGGEDDGASDEEGSGEDDAGEGDGDPPEGGDEGETPPGAEDEKPKGDWKARQIKKLRERAETEAKEKEDLQKRLAAAEALLAAEPGDRDEKQMESIRENARKEAADQVRQEEYIKRIDKGLLGMDAEGKKAFGDAWETRIKDTAEVFGEEMSKRVDFLEALTDLPNRAAVYNSLMSDPDKLEEVLEMPAHKMGMELGRLSDKLGATRPRQVSRAPAPITPIRNRGGERSLEDLLNDPNADMAEIDRRMAKAEEKRYGGR